MASGDVVNTAARLQAAAPTDGVLVDEVTVRATNRVITYRQVEPVAAKGKAAPVAVWLALGPRASLGVDVAQAARAALVGRDRELDLLHDAYCRARDEQSPQLMTLVGVPGIGKSRLVYELLQQVEADPELMTWRQGRCLPYGEGVAFWALGEIVKAQAGILETDTADAAAGKLDRAVADLIADEREAAWVTGHQRPLVGLGATATLGDDRRGEAFAAWRRFLEALAEQRPTVLVVEDLHWADDALGRGAELDDFAAQVTTPTPWLQAATALARGEFRRAADLYAEIGSRPDEAFARLHEGRWLLANGRRAGGNAVLGRALAFYREVGAVAYLREGEALLAAPA
jgi:AAA ATPase domain